MNNKKPAAHGSRGRLAAPSLAVFFKAPASRTNRRCWASVAPNLVPWNGQKAPISPNLTMEFAFHDVNEAGGSA